MGNIDNLALYKLSYGLYAITTKLESKDNAMIANTAIQLTSTPLRLSVTINKDNFSHDIIMQTKVMNVCVLDTTTPYSVFEKYGMASGRDANKFDATFKYTRASNGLIVLDKHINAYFSLQVIESVDVGTHTIFVCDVTEASSVSSEPSMTYEYYHANVKPKPNAQKQKGFVCKICGHVYEGDTLPEDYICPICKHGASDFEPINNETKSTSSTDTTKYKCIVCGAEFELKDGDKVQCPICGVEGEYIVKV